MSDELVRSGAIDSIKYKGKAATFNPPIAYEVYKVVRDQPFRIEHDHFYCQSSDERAVKCMGSYGKDYCRSDWQNTAAGAINSLRRKLQDSLSPRWWSSGMESSETVQVQDVEFQSLEIVVRAIRLAFHLHHVERGLWGERFCEVECDAGRVDAVVHRYYHQLDGWEFKSGRADFKGDKKWQGYLDHFHTFSFVTVPQAIRPADLPEGIGLFYLNRSYRPQGEKRRQSSEMPLIQVLTPTRREVEPQKLLSAMQSMIRKNGSERHDHEHGKRLVELLATITLPGEQPRLAIPKPNPKLKRILL